jgi:MFS family permease
MRWRILALLLAYAGLVHFNRISLPVAGSERLMAQFDISERLMGAVYSAYLVAYTLMMTPGGWFIDRYGPKASLLIVGFGSALCVAVTGAAGFSIASGATLVAVLIGIRIMMGIANAPFHPSAAHAISRWIPAPQRAWANGLVNAAALVGISSTFYLFGFMMDRLGWPAAFLVAAVVTGLVAAAWWAFAADGPAELPAKREEAGGIPPWRKRSLILLTISYAAVGYFQYLFFYWMQHYFHKVLELGKADSRLYSTIATVAMAAGMAAGGWLTDRAQSRWGVRRGRMAVTVTGMVASAGFLGAGILCHQPWGIVTLFSLALAFLGACEGAFWTTAIDLGGRQGGVAAAIVNTGGNAGGALAPYLTPLISHYFGWPVGIGVACVICFLGAVNWFWIDPDEGQGPEPVEAAPSKSLVA